MRKINYRITVNITQKTMKLGFRAKMPDEMQGKRIRVQAVFTQRQVERRFPMEVVIEEGEVGDQIRADAEILLPYVFYSPPRHKVNVIFTLWCGAEEICLDDQPFPVQKELFARAEIVRKRNLFKFGLCSLGLPFLLVRDYFKEDKNFIKAAKRANSAFTAASARSVSECRSKKKLVHHKVMQSIRTTRPSSRWRLSSFSSSMFVHSGPRRSCCRITLWRNSSSQMRAVAR